MKAMVILLGIFSLMLTADARLSSTEKNPTKEAGRTREREDLDIVKEGESINEQLVRVFSNIDRADLPSGILLDAGAVLYTGNILAKDGTIGEDDNHEKEKKKGGVLNTFAGEYNDLFRAASTNSQKRMPFPSLDDLKKVERKNSDRGDVALTLAVIDYESLQPNALDEEKLFFKEDSLVWNKRKGEYWDSHTYIGIGTSEKHSIGCGLPRLVLQKEQIVTNRENVEISDISIRFSSDNYSLVQPIKFGIPFQPPMPLPESSSDPRQAEDSINEKDNIDIPKASIDNGDINMEVTFKMGKHNFITTASFPFLGACPPPPEDYCDISPVTADVPYNGQYGTINVRVYKANGSIVNCQPKLQQILVIIDGFDVDNSRTQDDILADFGQSMDMFISLGFDLVVVDYQQGNDYIQRNGRAIQKLLVDVIPTLYEAGYENTDVVVVAGSMGTQTGRYALRKAEQEGNEHHTALFISIDGPYAGANIPIGLQLMLNFLQNEDPAAASFVASLNSPAARQLLLHHGTSYSPNSLFNSYFNEANTLGMPTQTRNVGIASGSGTGTLQNNGSRQKFSYLDCDGPLWTRFKLSVHTDHQGEVFYGRITKLFSSVSWTVTLNSGALKDDIQPGGNRLSPVQIADAFNGGGLPSICDGESMTYELSRHNFIPTTSSMSALFDATFHEKCNAEHVEATSGMAQVIADELVSFLANSAPPAHVQLQSPCGTPEPGEECLEDVQWWDGTSKDAWYDGANCYVTNVPSGENPFIYNNKYYVTATEDCPTSMPFTYGGCRVAILIGNNGFFGSEFYVQSGIPYIKNYFYGAWPFLNPMFCPPNTFQVSYTGQERVCQVNIPPGYSANDFYLTSGGGFLLLPVDDPCPSGGYFDNANCYFGSPPPGTNAFIWPPTGSSKNFYYGE